MKERGGDKIYVKFARDSPLEGEGFEPSVPPARMSLVVAPHAFFGRVDPCQFGATEALSYLSIGWLSAGRGHVSSL